MKRAVLFAFLVALPAIVFGSTQHYIVVTAHPFDEAVQRIPREDFDPAARAAMHVRPYHIINGFDAELTDQQVQRLIASGEVEDIEPVVERHVMDDAITKGQQTTTWGIQAVNARDVWPVTKGAAINGTGPIHVAVIDTGIDYHDPELQAVYKGGHNFITGSDDPLDDFGHGTHVSGIIAAADDGEGVVGVAPAVDIYALKILDSCGSGSSSNVIHALDWIQQKKTAIGGNWIANLSLGSDQSSDAEEAAFQNAADQGIIFFAAAGNSYDPTNPTTDISFPGAYPSVVSVGAIDSTDTVADFSQRGPDLKVVAPGVQVLSTIVSSSVTTSDGRALAAAPPVIVKDTIGTPLDNYCFPEPVVSAPFVFCGRGNPTDFPASVKGKIALIERGDITFKAKDQNAQAAGAIGVIVYDNVAPGDPNAVGAAAFGTYTTASLVPQFLPFLLVSQPDGQALAATPNVTVTLGFGFEGWALESGTSMATPHATAVAALAWATAPTASASDVQNAVINSATDLGAAGRDDTYGNGLVNALAAAKQLNPAAFGVSSTPPPPTGRPPGRRGH